MISKEELYDLYWNQGLSGYEIAEKFGFTPQWTYYWLTKYSIPIREQRPKLSRASKEELYDLYWNQKLSSREISQLIGCSPRTVLRWMKKYGIPRRNITQATKLCLPRTAFKKGQHQPPFTKKELENLCCKEKLCAREIGRKYGVSHSTVRYWLKRYRIPLRSLKSLWSDPSYAHRILKAINEKPTSPERKVIKVLEKWELPFTYVGDGRKVIGTRCPDLINNNGAKQVIEVFGRIWHDPDEAFIEIPFKRTEKGTIEYYKEHGYDCLVLWEDELDNENDLVARIKEFEGGE